MKTRIYQSNGKWHVRSVQRQPFDVVAWQSMLAAFNFCIAMNGENRG